MNKTLAIGGVLLLAVAARGQSPAPVATQPATAPDLSSPRKSLIALYTALRAGNVQNAKAALLFADAREEQRATTTLTTLWAPLGLMHAMEHRFGPPARRLFSNASLVAAADDALAKIQTIDIAVNGDSATVGEKKAAVDPNAETEITGVKLKKIGDAWKIVASTFQDITSEVPANQVATLQALSEATARASAAVKTRVDAGEFASADQAYRAYQALLQTAAKTTVPPPAATSPAH
jgi:hypothetical protein